MKKIKTRSPQETLDLGIKLGERIKTDLNKKVIALFAPMGAGKTLFTRGICIGFGLGDMASSPTFTIMNEYRPQGADFGLQGAGFRAQGAKQGISPTVFHFDMYRIEGDLKDSGLDEYLSEDGIVVIEWAENVEKFLPKNDTLFVKIEITGEDTREFEFENI
ncbi:MAG: tRNA (adenosine(37)-N6)-threonylcarbamoyltransferase complex ATPase subunit type 1 TsaE [Ruminococcus sp.]|nr:tRNA (adenosine(37)-N6)-threonylcarbamoyltransferase complex ATPase subunit type 1 TsaE [Ruminococcus sp.]